MVLHQVLAHFELDAFFLEEVWPFLADDFFFLDPFGSFSLGKESFEETLLKAFLLV